MGVGKTKTEKKIKWLNVIAIFFLGAFLGWLWETSFFFFRHEDWKNVGFLHGPWLPIYGVGCALIYLLKIAFGKNVFLLFTVSLWNAIVNCPIIPSFSVGARPL